MNAIDSDLPAHYWREMLERRHFELRKYVRKAAWTNKDEEEVDRLNEVIKHHNDMLEWCDLRDNEYWSWENWMAYQHEKNKPKVNEIIGELPVEENVF
jgi:hypothetical protein